MKAHKYWSLGALAAMIGTFYTGYKNNDIEKAQSLNSLSFSLVYRSFVHSFSFLIFYLDIIHRILLFFQLFYRIFGISKNKSNHTFTFGHP